MRNISQFINVLFIIFFYGNVLHSQTEKIKNIKIFGTNKNVQKYVFFKDEIINVSFDELSHNTNNYYYSIDHYDFQWNKTNIFKIKNYKIVYKEKGQIPLFYPTNLNGEKKINIGTAGKMTRLSTGYTFLNIQEHCKYIVKNLDSLKTYNIGKKYEILDKIFLKVLKKNAQRMPNIFFEIFNSSSETSIKFLSNKSNIFQDLSIISKMPKWPFIKALFN